MANEADAEKKIVDILIDRGIVTFSFDPPYVYTTGLKSPIYIDNRMLISFPKERSFILKELVKLIKGSGLSNIDYISSSLNYAAPFGVMVAEALLLPLVLVREEHRTHGKRNKIEGHLPEKAQVLIVEDHISTGAALVDNARAVRDHGGIVKNAIAITDYEIDIAQKSLAENSIKAFVLVKGSTIVEVATKKGKLTNKEKDEVLDWFKNPVKWGEVRGYYPEIN